MGDCEYISNCEHRISRGDYWSNVEGGRFRSKYTLKFEIAGFNLSIHAQLVINERGLENAWIERTISNPETVILGEDDNMHYIKAIEERACRKLRVVVNHHSDPPKIVTVFFDRRLKGKK